MVLDARGITAVSGVGCPVSGTYCIVTSHDAVLQDTHATNGEIVRFYEKRAHRCVSRLITLTLRLFCVEDGATLNEQALFVGKKPVQKHSAAFNVDLQWKFVEEVQNTASPHIVK